MNTEIRELNTDEATSVAGGFYFDDYCGTHPRPWPFPRPLTLIDQLTLPVINLPGRP